MNLKISSEDRLQKLNKEKRFLSRGREYREQVVGQFFRRTDQEKMGEASWGGFEGPCENEELDQHLRVFYVLFIHLFLYSFLL